ncbi:MAG: class II aldolase/adducin family protein [Candidatus Hydrogenedens sp.]|jgi:L-fuculose-phosphate aldolase|nr:class II aldolase/adducin family protein [Candidatus Hydrogenedens sp.]
MTETLLRNWICEIGRRLYQRDMIAAADGNISVRFGEDRFICTPSGMSKGFLRPDDLVIADSTGRKIAGEKKVTSEFFTHLKAYEIRPETQAVIHAHPTYATVLTILGIDTTIPILPEVVMNMVALPVAAYATPGSLEGAEVIATLIKDYDALLLERHGAITLGADLQEAYMRMERLEHAAKTLYLCHLAGKPKPLPPDALEKLMAVTVPEGTLPPPYPFPQKED